MRRIFYSVIVVTACLTTPQLAPAADMPVKTPAEVVTHNWSGFYLGAHAGYVWGRDAMDWAGSGAAGNFFININGFPTSLVRNPNGFVGGGQFGFNWQNGNLVLGLEADLSYTDMEKRATVVASFDPSRSIVAEHSLEWFGTLRARLGVAPTSGILAYATGGVAFGSGKVSTAVFRTPSCVGNICPAGSSSDTLWGWTAGGGLEFMAGANWSLKAEYLYYDLGDISYAFLDPAFPAFNFKARSDFRGHIARVGVNYRFGRPIVAPY
jgi:outer membrane immunogenic protein